MQSEDPGRGDAFADFAREKGLEGLKSYCRIKSIIARIS